jgi:hypothetical protein
VHARADDRADVAGIADTVEVHRKLASGLRPALAVDADHPGPGAKRAHRAEQLGLHVLSGDQDQLGLGPGGVRGRHQVIALDHEQAAALALAVGAELPDLLQLLVVGAGDQVLCSICCLLAD